MIFINKGILILFCLILSFANAEEKFNTRRLVSARTAAFSPIPMPASGECRAGTQYKIEKIEDLQNNIESLECIFAAGLPPYNDTVPQGYSYGYLLAAANTAFWNRVAELGYQGDFVVRTKCNGEIYNIGWLSVGGFKVGTAQWSADEFSLANSLPEGEYPIGKKKGIIMDFTKNFSKLCSPEGNESSIALEGFSPFTNSLWPIRGFIDVGRIVGIDVNDGGIITLNKAYATTSNNPRTVMMYATKTFDTSIVKPGLKNINLTVPIGPKGEEVIHYRRQGLESIFNGLNPFGNRQFERLQNYSIDSFIESVRTVFPFF